MINEPFYRDRVRFTKFNISKHRSPLGTRDWVAFCGRDPHMTVGETLQLAALSGQAAGATR